MAITIDAETLARFLSVFTSEELSSELRRRKRVLEHGSEWRSIKEEDAFTSDFSEIMLVLSCHPSAVLNNEEILQVSGCLGYALRQILAGESLSDPYNTVTNYTDGVITVVYSYDSTKSQRDDPDFATAFDLAAQYIQWGTPIRTTNRAGANTKGTKLIEGVGSLNIEFFVR